MRIDTLKVVALLCVAFVTIGGQSFESKGKEKLLTHNVLFRFLVVANELLHHKFFYYNAS